MRAGIAGNVKALAGIFSAVRTLYEHDHGDNVKGRKPAKTANSCLRSRDKKKGGGRHDYSGKKNGKDVKNGKESRAGREYSSVFAQKAGDYAIKSGYASMEMQKGYAASRESGFKSNSMGFAAQWNLDGNPVSAEPQTDMYVQKSAGMAETKQALSEMLSGVSAQSAYAAELDLTTRADAASFKYGRSEGMVKIEYNDPVFINNQWTYQRIFIRNEKDGSTVYRSTMDKAQAAGLETQVRRDDKFDTMYFDSLNGKRDGKGNAYWEAWVNGEIVEDALDKKELKKGDVVEWRLANERESFCGGGGIEERLIRPELRSKASNPLGLPMTEAGYLSGFGPPGSYGRFSSLRQGYSQNAHPSYGTR
jgi:hypothetical protein